MNLIKLSKILDKILFISTLAAFYVLANAAVKVDKYLFDLPNIIVFAILPVLFITANLFFIFKEQDKNKKINYILVLVSVSCSIYLLEFSLYIFEFIEQPKISRAVDAAQREGREYDERTAYEYLMDLRANYPDAMPTVSPYQWLRTDIGKNKNLFVGDKQLFPINSLSKRRIVFCNEGGLWQSYDSDRYGYRNDDTIWNNQKIDIVFVGDSFTQGACVKEKEVSSEYIKTICPKTLNLGLVGNGPLIALATVKEYLKNHKVGIVFWMFYDGNDFPSDLGHEEKNNILKNYLEPDFKQNLTYYENEINAFLLKHAKEIEAEYVKEKDSGLKVQEGFNITLSDIFFLRKLRTLFNIGIPTAMPDYALLQAVLAEAKNFVNDKEGELVFVYQPQWKHVISGYSERDKEIYQNIIQLVSKLGIKIIDMNEIFSKYREPRKLFYFKGSHYSSEGYKQVGETIKSWLMQKKEN